MASLLLILETLSIDDDSNIDKILIAIVLDEARNQSVNVYKSYESSTANIYLAEKLVHNVNSGFKCTSSAKDNLAKYCDTSITHLL